MRRARCGTLLEQGDANRCRVYRSRLCRSRVTTVTVATLSGADTPYSDEAAGGGHTRKRGRAVTKANDRLCEIEQETLFKSMLLDIALDGILAHTLDGNLVGGDEFVIVLSRLRSAKDLARAGEKLRRAIAETIQADRLVLEVTASVGTTLYDPEKDDARGLLMRADLAMYATKRAGSNRVEMLSA